MSQARIDFLARLIVLERTLSEAFVQDGALHEVEKNEVARLVRNGLAVVAFSQLEDFIRNRSAEVLASISTTGVTFNQLPEKVQKASTLGLLKALAARVRIFPDDATRISFVQQHTGYAASTAGSPYVLSDLTFGYDGSNVSGEEIRNLLGAFRVKNGWGQISALAGRVGFGALPFDSAFESAAKRRHAAAHAAMATTPYGDLIAFLSEARAIAFGFDLLLSTVLIKLRQRDQVYLAGGELSAADTTIVLIERAARGFRLRDFGALRARRVDKSVAALEPAAIARADSIGGAFGVLNDSGQLTRWGIPRG